MILKIDVTVIVALIAAISAIIAPIITAFINNYHQLKIRKMELYEQKRIEAINKYADAINSYLNDVCGQSEINFAKYKHTIYLYAPHSAWGMIDKINNLIDNKNLNDARKMLPELMKKFSPNVSHSKHYGK